jgi:hypothetical protein
MWIMWTCPLILYMKNFGGRKPEWTYYLVMSAGGNAPFSLSLVLILQSASVTSPLLLLGESACTVCKQRHDSHSCIWSTKGSLSAKQRSWTVAPWNLHQGYMRYIASTVKYISKGPPSPPGPQNLFLLTFVFCIKKINLLYLTFIGHNTVPE